MTPTSRQSRRERREAERQATKLDLQNGREAAAAAEPAITTASSGRQSLLTQLRAEAALIRSQFPGHSTGPRSPEGKQNSSGNSLQHGLASGRVIVPGEDPAAFDKLLADLTQQHQPANPTEELLVLEMAQSWWLAQRAIQYQNHLFIPGNFDDKRLALFLRYQTTHERAFHRALNTLTQFQKDRRREAQEFVSQKPQPAAKSVRQSAPEPTAIGQFVSQNHPEPVSDSPERPADPQKAAA
jgi:hypothetical protein